MSEASVRSVVILGGGTAGWLAAAYLAATARTARRELAVTVIEAPDIPTVGVGEGTWPTMRGTLAAIGIAEDDFLRECDASFKQGSRFDGWVDGSPGDSYLHPFTPPPTGDFSALLAAWAASGIPFATAMSAQAATCAADLAPRQPAMPGFAGAVNYAYHLDAGKFAALLARHATARLEVRHIADRMVGVEARADGDIAALVTTRHGAIPGDLFLDCSGHAALLIGSHFGTEWIDRSDVLMNDRAMALQVPVEPGSAIAAQTIATAHAAGWLWDIGLPGRRGIGCVYASRFCDDNAAQAILRDYVARAVPGFDPALFTPRRLVFPTGHRERFWRRNCLALGLSAGFLEPLEASAIVLIEISLRALAENFPASRVAMDFHAERFNDLFRYRWDRIVEFLKLHYLLSRRPEPYWLAQRDQAHIPARLAALVGLWCEQPPSPWDFPMADEIFSAASHQYILYGMGGTVPPALADPGEAAARLAEVRSRARALASVLPTNRAYLDGLASPGPRERTVLS